MAPSKTLALLAATGLTYFVAAAFSVCAALFARTGLGRAAHWTLRAGWGLQLATIAVLTWGAGQAPWTELSGALILVMAGAVGSYLILGKRTQGLGDVPVALLAAFCMGMAWLEFHDLGPVSPQLASAWLWFHVPTISLGFGVLTASAFISVLIFVRTEMRVAALQLMGALSIAVYTALNSQGFEPGSARFLIPRFMAFTSFAVVVLSFWILLTSEPVMAVAKPKKAAKSTMSSVRAITVAEKLSRALYLIDVAGVPLFMALVVWSDRGKGWELLSHAEGMRLWGGVLVFIVAGAFAAFGIRRAWLSELLPRDESLDRLSHGGVIFGFLFLSLGLLSGMCWAETVWGRYWAWEPKEAGILLVWLHYIAYLRSRHGKDWNPRTGAVLGLVGFGWMALVLLGVNLYWSGGLHQFVGTR